MNPNITPAASAVPQSGLPTSSAGPHDVRRPIVTKLATIGLRLFFFVDLVLMAPIDFARAVFGGDLEVETFDGRFCDCAEGYHKEGEACLLEGVHV